MTTPSYYPPGWDAERWKTASDEEFEELTADDFEKFHTGIRAHLGEDDAQAFFDEMEEIRQQRLANKPLPPSTSAPNFVRMQKLFPSEVIADFREWGFMVYRTAGYDDEEAVNRIKSTITARIKRYFDRNIQCLTSDAIREETQRARDKFLLKGVEGAELDGKTPKEIATIYAKLFEGDTQALSPWLHNLCLCVDDLSIQAIQHAPPGIAHVLAIAPEFEDGEENEDEAQDERWTGTFKVAIDSLVDPLFTAIGKDSLTPYELAAGITSDQVWVHQFRKYGGFKEAYSG
ncbi:hypothetical protein ARSEF4850_009614 [Beauveria asiatica]